MSYSVEDRINRIVGVLAGMSEAVKDQMPHLSRGIQESALTLDQILEDLRADEISAENTGDTPEPPATALKNTDKSGRWMDASDIKDTKEFLRGREALGFAFLWEESPDGYGYWREVRKQLHLGYITDETPLPTEHRAKILGYLEAHGVDVSEFTEPPAVEITAPTAEEIDATGETNLAEALAGDVGASNVDQTTIDATDEVTEADAIAAGVDEQVLKAAIEKLDAADVPSDVQMAEPTQEQIDAILNDDTPFEGMQKRSYFGDAFA